MVGTKPASKKWFHPATVKMKCYISGKIGFMIVKRITGDIICLKEILPYLS
jgi:hypothetical protein